VNKKSLASLAVSEAFLLSLLVLLVSEFVGSNISLLAWILQLIIGSAAIFNSSILVNELVTRDERKND